MAFYKFSPAIRLVDAGGAQIMGPLRLHLPSSEAQGIFLTSGTPKYPVELLGPYMNSDYEERWIFLGYRPEVELVFDLVHADKSGLANLLTYFDAGIKSGTYAALQFNAFFDTCTVWRGMYPADAWAPRPAKGRQRIGYELTIALRARDLITTPGDFSIGTW